MKKNILLLTLSSFFFSCDDNGFNNKNPYLPDYSGFYVDIHMDFTVYNNLKFPSNAYHYPDHGDFTIPKDQGFFIFNTGSGYNAFDAACPNQAFGSCSAMTVKGINLVCPCDKKEYSLFTGQSLGGAQYPLKQYRVEVMGNNVLRVYN